MNLNHYYPQIYWGCACLNVNANAVNEGDYEFLLNEEIMDVEEDEEETKSGKVAYDKVAEAISKFTQYKIVPPDINTARMGFIPKVENNEIMFGMKGINKIGDELILNIIEHRPFSSLKDFTERMVEDGKKLISKDKVINLIKAGCFNQIEGKSREEIMKDYIGTLIERHKTLDLRNFLKLIRYDLVPEKLNKEKGIYLFTKEARKNKDGQGFYELDDIMVAWYRKWMQQEPLYVDGVYKINASKWDAVYNSGLNGARQWIKENKEQLIEIIFDKEWREEWEKYASGDGLQWELDSMNFYHSGHPLSEIEFPFEHCSIYDLKENDFDGYWTIKGEQVPKLNLKTIVGTVLIKNKKQSIITLSTPDGIIKVKCYKQQFAKYDKVITDEEEEIIQDSFFEKGTHLKITGILRDSMMIPKVYKKNGVEPIERIVLNSKGVFNYLEDKK